MVGDLIAEIQIGDANTLFLEENSLKTKILHYSTMEAIRPSRHISSNGTFSAIDLSLTSPSISPYLL